MPWGERSNYITIQVVHFSIVSHNSLRWGRVGGLRITEKVVLILIGMHTLNP